MWSAALVYYFMSFIGFPVDVRVSCIIVSPLWASMTVLVTYFMTKSVWNKTAALIAALFVSIIPGYMSRSVSGSFDNECISIFALLFVFYFWIEAVKRGSMWQSLLCSLAYFYMASAWGGYVFIINLIPLYVLIMLVFGRYSRRLHVAYTTFYILGILLSMQIQFVSFMPVQSGEHLASFGMFGLMTLVAFLLFLYRSMTLEHFKKTIKFGVIFFGSVALVAVAALMYTGYITPWTGRFYNLLHPTYAKEHIPIIASVSEHQPTAWPHFFFDLHIAAVLIMGGIYVIIRHVWNERPIQFDYEGSGSGLHLVTKETSPVSSPRRTPSPSASSSFPDSSNDNYGKELMNDEYTRRNEEHAKNDGLMFIAVYGCASLYFSGVMVRLMLVLAPASCIVSGICIAELLGIAVRGVMRISEFLRVGVRNYVEAPGASNLAIYSDNASDEGDSEGSVKGARAGAKGGRSAILSKRSIVTLQTITPFVLLIVLCVMLLLYGFHCLWVASTAYSSPSIVFAWYQSDGTRVMVDDFREAYSWLRYNTDEDARVMSWWDYGYQITAVANRTVIVDNNTWNNSHIATVGTAMSSTEEDAWPILQYLDVDYILVLFGGLSGYSGDDINKFLWMVRIGGGVFPRIKEKDYLTKQGYYTVDSNAGPAFLKCMMYKMCYYDFGRITTRSDQPAGFDLARNQVIGNKDISFEHLEEAYTTQRWIVRIYRVKKEETF